MIGLLCFALAVLASPFKSKVRLEAYTPLFAKGGDVVEVSQIGVLRNPVVNELATADPRTTVQRRSVQGLHTRPRAVFPKDAPGVLNGTNDRGVTETQLQCAPKYGNDNDWNWGDTTRTAQSTNITACRFNRKY
jgi:hypothetical protein